MCISAFIDGSTCVEESTNASVQVSIDISLASLHKEISEKVSSTFGFVNYIHYTKKPSGAATIFILLVIMELHKKSFLMF